MVLISGSRSFVRLDFNMKTLNDLRSIVASSILLYSFSTIVALTSAICVIVLLDSYEHKLYENEAESIAHKVADFYEYIRLEKAPYQSQDSANGGYHVFNGDKKGVMMKPPYICRQVFFDDKINKHNPKDWVQEGLKTIRKTGEGVKHITNTDSTYTASYMLPLKVNKKCIKCHGHWNENQVLGATVVCNKKNKSQEPHEHRDALLFIIIIVWLIGNFLIFKRDKHLRKERETTNKQHQKIEAANTKLRRLSLKNQALAAKRKHMLKMITHDIRTPFNSLLGLCDLIQLETDINVIQKHIITIIKICEDTFGSFEQLLCYAVLESENYLIEENQFFVERSITKIISMQSGAISTKNIKVNKIFPTNTCILTDQKAFEAIIRNLLSNAVRYSHNNTSITLTVSVHTDHYKIIVADQGIGMSAEAKKMLLKTNKYDSVKSDIGKNIGMEIISESVKKLNGDIQIDDVLPHGTKFTVRIPKKNHLMLVE